MEKSHEVAQGAQLDKDARIALLERELDRTRERADMAEVELQHARAALVTQPAAGEQAKSKHRQAMDDLREERERSMATPPAAAHGDEAVRKDAQRLDFILTKCRKVVVEMLPRGRDVYVEEGVMGERTYPAVHHDKDWPAGSAEDFAIKREAIDAAMRAQGDGEVE